MVLTTLLGRSSEKIAFVSRKFWQSESNGKPNVNLLIKCPLDIGAESIVSTWTVGYEKIVRAKNLCTQMRASTIDPSR